MPDIILDKMKFGSPIILNLDQIKLFGLEQHLNIKHLLFGVIYRHIHIYSYIYVNSFFIYKLRYTLEYIHIHTNTYFILSWLFLFDFFKVFFFNFIILNTVFDQQDMFSSFQQSQKVQLCP